jgi:ADP-heptose:LPS heptosyltransferase
MAGKRVLIISLGNIANTIYTLPMANVLAGYEYRVEYAVSERGFSVINKNPVASKVFLLSMEKWSGKWLNSETWESFFKVVDRIKSNEYDIVIDCQQDFRSLLLFAMCRGKRKLTYSDAKGFSSIGANEIIDSEMPSLRTQVKNLVERNMNFLKYLRLDYEVIEFPLPKVNFSAVLKYNNIFESFDTSKKTVLISAGARNENKRWSVQNWKELITRIKQDYNLIFTGSILDKQYVKEIGGDGFVNLTGETKIESMFEILRQVDVVISGETEITALGWAIGHPRIITLFTCSSPEKYSPISYTEPDKYKSLYGDLGCQPCSGNDCLDEVAKCRNYPTVDDVIRALEN